MAEFTVSTAQSLSTIVNAAAAGDTITILEGTHRLATCTPKNNMIIRGEVGKTVILNGSRLLTSWQYSAAQGMWFHDGITEEHLGNSEATWYGNGTSTFGYAGERIEGPTELARTQQWFAGMIRPERLYMNNVMLTNTRYLVDAAAPGRCHIDYTNNRVWMYDNPTGKTMEFTATGSCTNAFNGSATNVTIRNLTIEKYGQLTQSAAINAANGIDWKIEDCTVQLNAAGGIQHARGASAASTGNYVLRCRIINNGQIGISGNGDNAGTRTSFRLIESEVAFNNAQGYFRYGWEAGGSKFTRTNNLLVQRCYFHDNGGPGIWGDVYNINGLIEYNTVTRHIDSGIFWEISKEVVIRHNIVAYSGRMTREWVYGANIFISTSGASSAGGIRVYGNRVVVGDKAGENGIVLVRQARGNDPYTSTELITNNVVVERNIVVYTSTANQAESGGATGGGSTFPVEDVAQNNVFRGNQYYMLNSTSRYGWAGALRTFSVWQTTYGMDTVAQEGAQTIGAIPYDLMFVPEWKMNTAAYAIPTVEEGANVVFFTSGLDTHQRDMFNNGLRTLIGTGQNESCHQRVTAYGAALRSYSDTDGGAFVTLASDAAFYNLGTQFTLLFYGQLTTMANNGKMICVPYAASGWPLPYTAISFGRNGTGTALSLSFASDGATINSAFSDAGAINVGTDGLTLYAVTRNAATVTFYRDGVQQGATKTVGAAVVPHFVNKRQVCIMQRSTDSLGEGATGFCLFAAALARVMTAQEIRNVYQNPLEFWYTQLFELGAPTLRIGNLSATGAPSQVGVNLRRTVFIP